MSRAVSFEVIGKPMPQGSKQAFKDKGGNARMKESGGLKFAAWRNAVSEVAKRLADEHGMFDEALHCLLEFRFPMPASRPKAVRAAGRVPMTVAPDVDKLARAVNDALQAAGLIRNDSQIVVLRASKFEVISGWCGVRVDLIPANESEQ